VNDYFKTHTREEFESLTASAMDVIEYELSLIPADTDKIALTRMLDPVLRQLAQMEKVRAEAYLSYHIKPRFKLKKEDVDGYRELVNKYRRDQAEAPSIHTASTNSEPVYTALFEGLVDLVEHNGSSERVEQVRP
jgi:predicted solute-binding protein